MLTSGDDVPRVWLWFPHLQGFRKLSQHWVFLANWHETWGSLRCQIKGDPLRRSGSEQFDGTPKPKGVGEMVQAHTGSWSTDPTSTVDAQSPSMQLHTDKKL